MALDTQTPSSSAAPPPDSDASAFSATALPTFNPGDSPYKPLNLPQQQVRPSAPPPQQQQPNNLGAVSHAGAAAYLIDNVLKGASHGYAQGQAYAADQYNKKLSATQSLYNDQAAQLYDLAKSGRAGTFTGPPGQDGKPTFVPSDEFNQTKGRMLASWQAMMQTVGERVPQPKKGKKGAQAQGGDDPNALLQQAMDHKGDPQGALSATYQLGLKIGPPVVHQITGFLTPEYVSKQRQASETGATQATTANVSAGNQLTHQQAQADRDRVLAIPEDKRTPEDKQKLDSAQSILSPVPKASVDKPITRPDLQTVKLKNGQEISAQWNGKQWTYLNGTEIPSDQLGGEAKVAQKAASSQWAQGLNAYAQSHKADPNDWQTIRSYEQDQYSAKNPMAERRLALTARNSDIAAANLALRQASTDWSETKDIFKQLGPDMKIQAAAKAADEYIARPTGPGDVALTLAFFEAAKAADPGSGSGIRFTKQEQDLIHHARSYADAAQANVESWGRGTLYDDKQRQEMADILKMSAKRSNEATANYLGAAQKLNPRATAAATGGASDGNTGKFTVTDPKGKVHPFDTQEQADHFKKLAGIH